MTKPLKQYHKSWLSVHPEYDEEWLKSALSIGFDVHHIDGNRENNSPDNLIMIECRDHMALHGSPELSRMAAKMMRTPKKKERFKKAPKSVEVYGFEMRLELLGMTKVGFGNRLGIHKNTVNKWGDCLPYYAYQFLLMLEEVAKLRKVCDSWLKADQ